MAGDPSEIVQAGYDRAAAQYRAHISAAAPGAAGLQLHSGSAAQIFTP
jgi:hypothetical protein